MAAKLAFNRCLPSSPAMRQGPAQDLAALTLREVATAIRSGGLSSREITEACLARIAALDGREGLNAFLSVDADGALAAARRCDERAAKGDFAGPLHGVPIAVKDAIDTAGLRTTGGAKVFETRVPSQDAPLVRRLRDAGAIVLGKTNLHECSYGITSNNPHFGPVRNPCDPTRIPGGSSGGSGAAVSAGLCPGAIGTDTGGSVRIPAALCGGVGFKPTLGRVDTRGMMSLSWTCDVAGPMTRSVGDALLLLKMMAETAPDDETARLPSSARLRRDATFLRGLRIGVPRAHVSSGNDASVDSCMRQTEQVLRDLGVELVDVAIPGLDAALGQGFAVVVPESMVLLERYWAAGEPGRSLRADLPGFGPDFAAIVASELGDGARPIPAHVHIDAVRVARERLRANYFAAFEEVDLLLTPTTPAPAVEFAEHREMLLNGERVDTFATYIRYTFAVSLAGLPAISIPAGCDARGLPLGVQLIGAPWREATIAEAAHAFEVAMTA